MDNQSQLTAVEQSGYAIQHIKNPSEEVQLAAVRKNGWAIQYIENPSEEVQLAAVQQNGEAIQWIDYPSEEVQLAAVQQNGEAIQWIECNEKLTCYTSETVQLAAVRQNHEAIKFIRNPSKAVQLAALKQIENPSEEVQLAEKNFVTLVTLHDNSLVECYAAVVVGRINPEDRLWLAESFEVSDTRELHFQELKIHKTVKEVKKLSNVVGEK